MIWASPTAAEIWKRIGVLIADPNREMERRQAFVRSSGSAYDFTRGNCVTGLDCDVAEKGHRRAEFAAVADRDCLHPRNRASKGDCPRPGGSHLRAGRRLEIDPVVTSIASNGCVNLDNRSGDGCPQTGDDQDF